MADGVLGSIDAGGRLVFRLRRDAHVLVAEWAGMGVLRAHEDGSWSEFIPAPGLSPRATDKLRDGVVRALLRHLEGKQTLHGSAVVARSANEADARAIVCVGAPGAGKSTIAAALCADARMAFLADDATLLERDERGAIYVAPSREAHWLRRDAAPALGLTVHDDAPKLRVTPTHPATSRVPLGAIVFLAFDEALSAPLLEPLRGAAKFEALRGAEFRFLVDSREASLRDFVRLADLAERVPTFALRRPHRIADLAQTLDALRGVLLEAGTR